MNIAKFVDIKKVDISLHIKIYNNTCLHSNSPGWNCVLWMYVCGVCMCICVCVCRCVIFVYIPASDVRVCGVHVCMRVCIPCTKVYTAAVLTIAVLTTAVLTTAVLTTAVLTTVTKCTVCEHVHNLYTHTNSADCNGAVFGAQGD